MQKGNLFSVYGKDQTQRKRSSQGLIPVCFLNAVEKCEMEEYPSINDTSVTVSPFSYKRYLACSMRWLW